jgi:hypothetical protein
MTFIASTMHSTWSTSTCHDDNKVPLPFEKHRQRRKSVKNRHFDVKQHDVGVNRLDLLDRLAAVAQRADHLDIRLGAQPA